MNILLLGSGGREHAIAWKIAQSPKVDKLFIAPGNAGTALVGTNVDIKADDFAAIKDFALANQVKDRVPWCCPGYWTAQPAARNVPTRRLENNERHH